MAGYQQKEGDIILFVSEDTSGKKPTLKGKMLVNGETLEVALWEKKGNRGIFYAGKAQTPRAKSGSFHQNEEPSW